MEASVCVILINYNTLADTVECVESLRKMEYAHCHIMLVDNASDDAPAIRENAYLNENCDVILSDRNDGFSAGNNIGIRYAQEKYNPDFYWVLNNDTVVQKDSLRLMVDMAQQHLPKVGIVAGRIHFYDNKERVSYHGGEFNFRRGRPHFFDDDVPIQEEISFASGCSWLIPKHVINQVGYLNESFFMYAEDSEYCCRVMNAGLKILYCDQSIIYHKISASSKDISDFSAYYMMRNDLYVMHKYAQNRWIAWIIFFYDLSKDLLKGRKKIAVSFKGIKAFIAKETGRNEEY